MLDDCTVRVDVGEFGQDAPEIDERFVIAPLRGPKAPPFQRSATRGIERSVLGYLLGPEERQPPSHRVTQLGYSITQLSNSSSAQRAAPTMIAMAMKIDAITIATATVATLPEVPSRRMAYAEHAQTAHN
jgi:hypothetical protein